MDGVCEDFELFADFSLPITQITNRNPAFSLKWMAKFAATCSARAGPQKLRLAVLRPARSACSDGGVNVLYYGVSRILYQHIGS